MLCYVKGFMKPESDVVQGGTDDIISFAGEEKDGSTIIIFKRKINTGDNLDRVIKNIDQVSKNPNHKHTIYNCFTLINKEKSCLIFFFKYN